MSNNRLNKHCWQCLVSSYIARSRLDVCATVFSVICGSRKIPFEPTGKLVTILLLSSSFLSCFPGFPYATRYLSRHV